MNPTKAEKLTAISLAVFRLNGLLLEWGDGFCLPHGLTSARWQVLGAVAMAAQSPDAPLNVPPSVPQIAAAMGITRQGVQKQVNLLIKEGLVQVRPNPGHKRSPLYALTKKGENTYRKLHQRWQQHTQDMATHFSAVELDAALRVLSGLSRIYSPKPENPGKSEGSGGT